MNGKRLVGIAALIGSLASVSMPASAQEANFYVGGSLGQMEAKEACDGVIISCDDKDTAWRIFAGYRFHPNFAVELGYADLGEVSASAPGINASVEATALDLAAVGIVPLGDRFSLFGKIGVYRGESDGTANVAVPGFVASASASETNSDFTYGLGAGFEVNRSLGLRAEWQRYEDVGGQDVGESDVDVLSVGVRFKF